MKTAELRKILKQNNVDFPPEAKKKELVAIFWSSSSGMELDTNQEPSKEEGLKKPRKRTKKRKVSTANKEQAQDNNSESLIHDTKSEQTESNLVSIEEPGSVIVEDLKSKSVTPVQPDSHEKSDTKLAQLLTPSKHASPSNVSKLSVSLKKRRSMLQEVDIPHSDSPSKGNLFEIESDSDDDFPSPNKKRLRADLLALASLSQKPRTLPTNKIKSMSSTPSKRPSSDGEHTLVNASDTKNRSLEIKSDLFVSEEGEEGILAESGEQETIVTAHTESKPLKSSSIRKTPSNHDMNSSKTEASQELSTYDTAPSFDKALEKLKQAIGSPSTSDDSTHGHQDEELAKYLGVDIRSVKPKVKGKRVITPRRPIYILKADLSQVSDPQTTPHLSEPVVDDLQLVDDATINMLRDDLDDDNQELSSIIDPETHYKEESRPSSVLKAISYLVLWLFIMSTVLYSYWLWQQTILVGYCGHEINRATIPKSENYPAILSDFGDYLDKNFKPHCIDCPQHARCFPNLEIACYDDFVPYAPWYYKYAPFFEPKSQRCIPDTKKAEKIEIMIDIALDLLRARNANKMCGSTSTEDLDAGISLHDLHDLLLTLKAPYITIEEFEELWERSVVELEKEPEIIVRQVTIFKSKSSSKHYTNNQVGFESSQGQSSSVINNPVAEKVSENKVFRSTSLSHLSFKCLVSNTLLSILVKFKLAVVILACITLISSVAFWKFQQSQLQNQKIETIYKEVLNKLQRQARLGRESAELPAYVGSIQLRDLILSSENNLAYKMRLWEGISRKVDRNTNVRSQLLEVHGEVMKVWQWIGSLE